MTDLISVNGESRSVAAATVTELLRLEEVDPSGRFLAVAVNGAVVPRSCWDETRINPGDAVEIVRPAPGG
jgi:sulfur carrier protein